MMSDVVKREDFKTIYKGTEEELKNLDCVNDGLRNIPKQQFACDLCAAIFSLKQDIKCHIDVHTGLGSYKDHSRIDRPYKCDICSYTCIERGHLTQHVRTHSGEKPYMCEICLAACSRKEHLKKHSTACPP